MTLEYIKDMIESRSGQVFDNNSRERHRTYLRCLYYTLAREYTNHSLQTIAKLVNRDHSTAVYGIKLFEQAYSYEPSIRELYENFISDHPHKVDKVKISSIKELNKALSIENDALKAENMRLMLEIESLKQQLVADKIRTQ